MTCSRRCGAAASSTGCRCCKFAAAVTSASLHARTGHQRQLHARVHSIDAALPSPHSLQIERIRTLSDCAQQLTAAHDKDAGRMLGQVRRAPLQPCCTWAGAALHPGRSFPLSARRLLRAGAGAALDVALRLHACTLSRLPQKMAEELFSLPLEEALPILRAYGHYLK